MPAHKKWTEPCWGETEDLSICQNPPCSLGLCDKHYRRLRAKGTTANPGRGRPPLQRMCKGCGETDPQKFYPNNASECKMCHYERSKEWLRNNPGKAPAYQRKSLLKRAYGLTEEEYDKRVEAQDNKCDSCGGPPTMTGGGTLRLVVDHDHSCCPGTKSCGKCVRGLICAKCNFAAGYLDDDPEKVLALYEYLLKWQHALSCTG
jgi:hypothetical protein